MKFFGSIYRYYDFFGWLKVALCLFLVTQISRVVAMFIISLFRSTFTILFLAYSYILFRENEISRVARASLYTSYMYNHAHTVITVKTKSTSFTSVNGRLRRSIASHTHAPTPGPWFRAISPILSSVPVF